MSKTPEELAEEYTSSITRESERFIRLDVEYAFYAGYKAAQQWISVEDRLPKEGLMVFIFVPERGGILTATRYEPYETGQSYGWYFLGGRLKSGLVPHWMPLPPLPPTSKEQL